MTAGSIVGGHPRDGDINLDPLLSDPRYNRNSGNNSRLSKGASKHAVDQLVLAEPRHSGRNNRDLA